MHATLSLLLLLSSFIRSEKTPDSAWMNITSKELGFSVQMPGTPNEEPLQTLQARYGRVFLHVYTVRTGKAFYFVSQAEMNNYKVDLPVETFRRGREKLLSMLKAKLVGEKKINLNGFPGSEYTAKTSDGGILKVRTFIGRTKGYQIACAAKKSDAASPDLNRFLTSFRLVTN